MKSCAFQAILLVLIGSLVLHTNSTTRCEDGKVQTQRPIVGAIRWDAWHGDKGVPGRAVEKSLSPAHWHGRVPFYGQIISQHQVEIRADRQEVMDQEIAFASEAGLDYWAFCLYRAGDPMNRGLELYLKSSSRNKIHFCLLLQAAHLGTAAEWPKTAQEIVGYLKEQGYQNVEQNRPLIYLTNNDQELPETFGSWTEARHAFNLLSSESQKAGLGKPYIVVQNWEPADAARYDRLLGFDAISAYAVSGSGEGYHPFKDLAKRTRIFWDQCKNTGVQVVPLVMSGWDRRPRQENPVPWEQGDWTRSTLYYAPPRPEELADLVGDAMRWTEANPAAAKARTVLIYAWNENDEGGWLVPTHAEGNARLEAIRKVLKPRAGMVTKQTDTMDSVQPRH